jgi:hypothetical protein
VVEWISRIERSNGLSEGRGLTMLCISFLSCDGYLISLATGALRCRILIRASRMPLLAAVFLHCWQPREWSMYVCTFRLQVQM